MNDPQDNEATASAEPSPEVEIAADLPLTARLEALLLTADRPLSDARLAELLGLGGKGTDRSIRTAIEKLNADYEQTGRSFRAQPLAGGWQLLTLPDFAPLLARLHRQREQTRLSQAALETLAIIAYRQPIMRAEIEAIRGVGCGEVLRALLDRRLIRVTGKAEQLGRPLLYGTTPHFLKIFGLPELEALPALEDNGTHSEPESGA